MSNTILKELYIGREIFINSSQESYHIEQITKYSDHYNIDIGLRDCLRFYYNDCTFRLHSSDKVLVTFDATQHRKQYLENEINSLKASNKALHKKTLDNWDLIRKYQTELMGS